MAIKLKPISQQVMVITGASSGIGLATAEAAAKKGAKLVLAARSQTTLAEIVARFNSEGVEAIFVATDVANRADVQHVADAAVARFGRIDTWVNDAGTTIYGRLDEIPEEDHRRLFDVNFWGVVHGSLTALRYLRGGGGAIINLGSEVSDAVVPLQGMYSASKHAVKGFTDALRVEVQEVDQAPVSITLIQPGAVNTPWPDNARNYMDKQPKLPDPQIEPEKVAEAILKAATRPTRYIKVGGMSKLNTTVAKVAPGLADKMAARQIDTQKRDEPPQSPEGTLYQPGESGQTHGR